MASCDANKSIVGLAVCLAAIVLIQPAIAGEKDADGGSRSNLITSVPRTMSYQGFLKDAGGQPVTDTLEITFRIYDVELGGSALWTEAVADISIIEGKFTAVLGETLPINLSFDVDYWMSLQVEGDALEMTPRLKLHMSSYAARSDTSEYASNSDFLDGLDSGDFAGAVHNHDDEYVNEGQADAISSAMILDSSIQFGDIGQNGAGAGQIMKWNGSDWVASEDETGTGWNWSDSSSYGPDSVFFSNNANHAYLSDSADAITDGAVDFADIGENGAAYGQVMKWNGTAWVAAIDEVGAGGGGWTDDGNIVRLETSIDSVGIGTNSPSEKLHVAGNLLVTGKGTIGTGHANTGYFAFIAGTNNTASGDYSAVSGGGSNTAAGARSTIGGGASNMANSDDAVVSGGWGNVAGGEKSVVAGGLLNSVDGYSGVVGGGKSDSVKAVMGGALSGFSNLAGDTPEDTAALVCGGYDNSAIAKYSTVGGGIENSAGGGWATVGGGWSNNASETYSTVSGGVGNIAGGMGAAIGGGFNNSVNNSYSTVSGGNGNVAGNIYSNVNGGRENNVTGSYGVIGGGRKNLVGGSYSVIPGGYADTITSSYSFLFGIDSDLTQDSTFMVDMPHIHFGDEADGYEFPISDGAADQVMASDGSGQLSWVDMSGDGGGWADDGTVIRLETNTDSVGIGTSTPTEKLDVSGNIHASGTITSGSSIVIDGSFDQITASGGTIDFDNENLVTTGKAAIGPEHTNTGANTFVAGSSNTVSGDYSSVAGGQSNVAGGGWSFAGGGQGNQASNIASTIGGGVGNYATGYISTIGGGNNNTASGRWSTIAGGVANLAEDTSCTVGGGQYNKARGIYSVVAGGGGPTTADSNSASGDWSAIGGGLKNAAGGDHATISGGWANVANGNIGTIGGGASNTASGGATVGGGSSNNASHSWATVSGGLENTANGYRSTIGGGSYNTASGDSSTIGGGADNNASGGNSTVSGGRENDASAINSTIGGGYDNEANGVNAIIGGGIHNIASGYSSTIPGGWRCAARGDHTFAACNNAHANHFGSIVIAANGSYVEGDTITSGGSEQMVLRADGGLFITNAGGVAPYDNTKLITTRGGAYLSGNGTNWTNASDENIKENFKIVNGSILLRGIAELPISQWNYRCDDDNVTHIGPTAQDFYEVFGLGNDDKSISTVDPAGVALAGIKELIQENRELRDLISQLERRITELERK